VVSKKDKGGAAMKKSTTSSQIFIDPVCLMKVNHNRKDLRFTHKMRTYYFCSGSCRKTFEMDPLKYLEPKTAKRKGWWGRYLERLEKATGGKAPHCH